MTFVRYSESKSTRTIAETKDELKLGPRVNTLCYFKSRKILHLKMVQSKTLLVICCPFQTDSLLGLEGLESHACFTRINLVKAIKNHFSHKINYLNLIVSVEYLLSVKHEFVYHALLFVTSLVLFSMCKDY